MVESLEHRRVLAPLVSLGVDNATIPENNGVATFTATLSETSGQDVTVDLGFTGTATLTDDFVRSGTQIVIAAGETSGSITVTAADDGINEAEETVIVDITSVTNGTESGVQQATTGIVDDDPLAFTVTIAESSMSENGGGSSVTITRNTTVGSVVVDFFSDDTSEAEIIGGLRFLNGMSVRTMSIAAVDDAIVDGTQTVTITAAAPGYLSASDTIDVTDDDTPLLSVAILEDSISENGGLSNATVVRNTDPTNALTVNLSSSDTSEATVPATVSFAPGERTSETFLVTAVDDAIIDGTFGVSITASAPSFPDGVDTIDVIDDDAPRLDIQITSTSIAENGGMTTATVTRNSDTTDPLSVTLVVDDSSELSAPSLITIPAGETTSAAFTITGVDDTIVDFNQTVTLTASAAAHADGTGTVDVEDDDSPTLTIDVSATSIAENDGAAATTVTITRNTEPVNAIGIRLSSDDTSEATLRATAVIPAGESSVTVDLDAVDDAIADGTQTVTISAEEIPPLPPIPDTTFTSLGYKTTGMRSSSATLETALQADGKILAIATTFEDDSWEIQRINPDGTDDNSFGVDGSIITRFIGETSLSPEGIVVHDDGRFTVLGNSSDGWIVARYTSRGVLDTTFSVDGWNRFTVGTSRIFQGVADSGGSLFVAGTHDDTVIVARIGEDGQLDPSFGTAGIATPTLDATGVESAIDIAKQPDGKLVIAGEANFASGNEQVLVARLNADGSVDGTFGNSGFRLLDVGVASLSTTALALQPDGRIVVVGRQETATNDWDWLTSRFTAGGDVDTSFSGNGFDIVSFGTRSDSARDVVVLADGRIVVVGYAFITGNNFDRAIVRYQADGTPDTTFSQDGKHALPDALLNGGSEYFRSVEVDRNGKLVTLSTVLSTLRVARWIMPEAALTDTDTVDVIDNETALTVVIAANEISENGGSTTATVSRTSDTTNPLTVSLASSDAGEATVPDSITIPAGQLSSAPFTISGVNDNLFDGTQTVTVTATAVGHLDGSDSVDVTDDEPPGLLIHVDDPIVSEGAGTVTATISRNSDTTAALTVTLRSDDTSLVTVPSPLTIPAGQTTSAPITITIIDNDVVDGTRLVELRAIATGHFNGVRDLELKDDETPELTVDFANASISEAAGSAATTATITRNFNVDTALTVNLTSSNTGEATVPSTATIPAGQRSVTIDVDAVNDTLASGTHTVTISATAELAGDPTEDASFGIGGTVITPLRNNVIPKDPDVAVQPDGKIIAIGRHETLDNSWRIMRLNPDGSNDNTFGTNGSVVTAIPGETSTQPQGIVIHGDGRITVLGRGISGHYLLARYTPAGVLDTTFSGDGISIIDFGVGTSGYLQEGLPNPDGSVWVAGTVGSSAALSLIGNDGNLVSTTVSNFDLNSEEQVRDIGRQADGKIVVTGSTYSGTLDSKIFVLRFNTNGSLDTTFGTSGVTQLDLGTRSLGIRDMAIQADDAIVVTGFHGSDQITVRFTPDGILDASFSGDGIDIVDVSGSVDEARDVVVQADGKLVVVGRASYDRSMLRYNQDGTLDTTFSSDGKHTFPPLPESFEQTVSAALQSDGRIVTYSGYVRDFRVERFYLPGASVTGTGDVDVTDDDVPELTISIVDSSISEAGGTTTATVTRNTVTTNALTVTLASSDEMEATVPTSVTIPAGQNSSAPFTISAVRDFFVDDTQIVTITASAPGHADGNDSLGIENVDVPTLTVDVAADSVIETATNPATTVTITRNTDTTNAMDVNLISSDPSKATVPATATIAAGQSFVTVDLDVIDDAVADGTQTVTITAREVVPGGDPIADPSFGTAGTVITTLRNNVFPKYLDLAVQPDGKIIAIGRHETLGDAWRVVRLNPDGSFDTTFGTAGSVVTQFAGQTTVRPASIVLHDDGRISVIGPTTRSNWLVARYTADGVHDTTFSGDGIAIFSVSTSTLYDGIANPDGSLIVIGNGAFGVGTVIGRIRNDGTLDNTFGTGGSLFPTLHPIAEELPRDIARRADGKLIIAGRARFFPSENHQAFVARLNADGTVDTSFGTDGYSLLAAGDSVDWTDAMALQDDGGIVVAGTVDNGGQLDWFTARFRSDGAVDTSFSGDGYDIVDFENGTDYANDVVLQSNGKIIVTGRWSVPGDHRRRGIIRYHTDGTLDTTLSGDGIHAFPLIPDPDEIDAAVIQPDGKLLTFSGYQENYRVERWLMPDLQLTGSDTVDVTDDDVPSLTVNIADASISEGGGTTTATVSRNTPTTDALTVTLLSDDTGEATVPATITIAAGQTTSAPFTITAVDDSLIDGSQTVTVTASAAAHADGDDTVSVTDDDFLTPVISSSETTPTRLSPIPVTVDFSETVTGFTLSDLVVSGGAAGNLIDTGNGSFTFDLTPSADGDITVDIAADAAADAVGKGTLAAARFTISSDRTVPAPAIAGPSVTITEPFTVTIDFGEVVSGFVAADVSVGGGTITGLVDHGGGQYTATIDASVDGVVTIDIAADVAADAAGNLNVAATQHAVIVDTLAPTPVIAGPPSPTNSDPFEVTIDFGETVNGFEMSDITVTGGTATGLADHGNGVFTATIDAAADGTVTIEVAANVAIDNAGNNSLAAVPFAVDVDTTFVTPFIDLAFLAPSVGVTIVNATSPGFFGDDVEIVGDVNGDGYDDLLIGDVTVAVGAVPRSLAGASYLIYGGPSMPGVIQSDSLGSAGVVIIGANAGDRLGRGIGGGGDINNDGYDDLVIGAIEADSDNATEAGTVQIIYGSPSLPETIDLATPGAADVTIHGAESEDQFGRSINGQGDINGDGFADLIVGASRADVAGDVDAGITYVIFGSDSLPASIDVTSLGTDGVMILGAEANDLSGLDISNAGDVNGDGFDDLITGVLFSGSAPANYLIFGGPSMPMLIDLASLGSAGVSIFAADSGDFTSRAHGGAGDINGDGFDDLVFGARYGDGENNLRSNSGESYVVFGRSSFPSSINLGTIGSTGLTIYGKEESDLSGNSVTLAGDINGDGLDDLLIGARHADSLRNGRSQAGEAYVVFGSRSLPSTLDLAVPTTSVLTIYGAANPDTIGFDISTSGDVNGDGFDDILLGSPASRESGKSFVVYGSDFTGTVTHGGTSAPETIFGNSADNVIVGGEGDDVLLGRGGADVLRGGEGDDILAVRDLNFDRIVGGNGHDTLRIDTRDVLLDLTSLPDNRILGIEEIDIRGTGNNELRLDPREVLNISDETNTLIVRRDLFDSYAFYGTGWVQQPYEFIGPDVFRVYTNGAATIKMQSHDGIVDLSVSSNAGTEADESVITVTATSHIDVFTDQSVVLSVSGVGITTDDYILSNSRITIPHGERSGSVSFTVVDDATAEAIAETATLTIMSLSALLLPGDNLSQDITITDNDYLTPGITTTAADPTNLSTIPMTVDFGQPVTGFTESDLTISGGSSGNFVDSGGGTFTFDLTPAADGQIEVDIAAGVAADAGGKATLAATQFAITSDRTRPTPSLSGPGSPTNLDPFTITIDFGEVVSDFTIGDIAVAGGTATGLTDDGGGTFSATIDPSADGTLNIDIAADSAVDTAGNSSLAAATFTMTVDTTAPVITAPNAISVEGNVTGGASNANADILAFLSGVTVADAIDASPTLTNNGPAFYPLGDTIVTFTGTDEAGNSSMATTTVTVVDTTAPVVTAPGNISVEGDSTGGAANANSQIAAFLSAATATDIVDDSLTITHNAPALFPVGDTVVTFSTTDDDGNTGTATATVTVVDTTDPAVTAPADITVEGDSSGGASDTNSQIAAFLNNATAIDIVDDSLTITHNAPALFPVGDTVVTFSTTDDAGNTGTATATVTVVDTTDPAVTAPADITVEGDSSGGTADTNSQITAFLTAATATDIVDDSLTITHNAPALFPVGATVVTFSTTDDAGNVGTATATVTVVDTTAPSVTAPADISAEGDTTGGASDANAQIVDFLTGATATDIVDDSLTITHDAPALFPVGDTLVTFSTTDDDGNTGTATATVTVVDTTDPAVTAPADITVEGDSSGGASDTNSQIAAFLNAATATDIVDDSLTITHNAPALFPIGDTVVTFSTTDDAGNTGTATATVTVVDTTDPSVSAPADITVEGDTTGGAADTNSQIVAFLAAAIATDIVDDSLTITHDAPALFPIGETLVTFSTTDDAGNVGTATATVTIEDTTAPAVTAPADISVEGDTTGGASDANAQIVAFLAGASATDIVDDSLTVTHDAPAHFPVGDTLVTFSTTDDEGNVGMATATVTVVDTTAPVVTAPSDITVEGDATGGAAGTNAQIVAFLVAATASDVVDDSLTITHDAPALFPVGDTVVTFSTTDDAGNTGTATATVTVVDTTTPVVTAPSDITVEGDATGGASAANAQIVTFLAAATASDIVDDSLTISHDAPALFPIGETLVTFSTTDDAGNTATGSATVTVVDTSDPAVTAPTDITVEGDTTGGATDTNSQIVVFLAAATATDIVDDSLTITHNAPALFPIGDTVVTFSATDNAGNVGTSTATVTVVDTTQPVVTPPNDITVEGDTTGGAADTNAQIVALLAAATASDIVDDSLTITHNAPALFPVGDTVVTFSTTDDAGNTGTATAIVTVVDTTDPSVTAPTDITVEGDATGGATDTNAQIAAFLTAATATDTVDDSLTISHDAPAVFPIGDTVVTFSTTDDAGNTGTATATVTVVDTTVPVVTAPNDLTAEGDATGGASDTNAQIVAFLAAATASDIVDDSLTITHNAPALFPIGDTVVTFSTTDDSGNVGSATATVTVTDTTAPVITAPSDISVEGDATGGASDANAQIVAFLAAATASDIVDDSLSITHDAPALLPVGDTVVTFSTTDDAGNVGTATATVTVTDTTAPVVTAPSEITVEGDAVGGATDANAQIAAFLAAATASDIVDDSLSITHDAPALLPVGDTVVTFSATDDSGNTGTASVTVTVVDTTDPVVTAPTDLVIEGDATGGATDANAQIAAFLSAATAADIVDDSLTITHDAPTLFPVGDTVVTFSTSDDAGNVGNATATVTVTDTTNPGVTAPANITVEGDTTGGASNANAQIAAFLAAASASDIVDDSLSINHNAPALFPIGDTVVTFSTSDDEGNVGTDSATVTVVDTTAPVLTVPADIVVMTSDAAGAGATHPDIVEFLSAATASDVVDANPSVSASAPSLFVFGETLVRFTATDAEGNSSNASASVTVISATPPTMTFGAPDGGDDPDDLPRGPQPTSWANQRARLGEIVLDFHSPVSALTAANLTLTNLGVNAPVDPDQVVELRDDQLWLSQDRMQVRIKPDPEQLEDGVYQLELSSELTGGPAFTMTGDRSNQFFVLAGDWNGSGGVNIQDFATFAYWFANPSPPAPSYVDLNNSGGINIQDFSGFAANFGKGITFPGASSITTPTTGEGELEAALNSLTTPGDVNGDGAVTALDALRVINHLNDVEPTDGWQLDVNRDGEHSAADALYIINRLQQPPAEPASTHDVALSQMSLNLDDDDNEWESLSFDDAVDLLSQQASR